MNLRLLVVALLVTAPGCDEETLDLGPRDRQSDGGGAGGGEGGRGGSAGGGGAPSDRDGSMDPPPVVTDAGVTITPMPDRAAFDSVILPILDARCSTAPCHAGPPPRDDQAFQMYGSPLNPIGRLTGEQRDTNYNEFIAFVDWLRPTASDILRYPASTAAGDPPHPTPSPALLPGTPDYEAIVTWIEDATRPPPEPDMGVPDMGAGGAGGGGGSGGGVPCDALPVGDVLDRHPDYWRRFEEEINPMMLESCTGGGCHEIAGNGGGLWLRGGGACDLRWNFLTVHWFIDPRDPPQSPLLTQPVNPLHGGREVFHGRADPRYGQLKLWIELGLAPSGARP